MFLRCPSVVSQVLQCLWQSLGMPGVNESPFSCSLHRYISLRGRTTVVRICILWWIEWTQRRCRSQCVPVISSGAAAVVASSYVGVEILNCPFPTPTNIVVLCFRVSSWWSSLVGMRVCLPKLPGSWRSPPLPDGTAASDCSLWKSCVALVKASVSWETAARSWWVFWCWMIIFFRQQNPTLPLFRWWLTFAVLHLS